MFFVLSSPNVFAGDPEYKPTPGSGIKLPEPDKIFLTPRRFLLKKTAVFLIAFFIATGTCLARETLVAIDVLLEPDNIMTTQAKADNAYLRRNYPEGFALDATHAPHITVLQCYVMENDLEKVFDAVKGVNNLHMPAGMELRTTGYSPWSPREVGLIGIAITPTPESIAYQKAIIEAVKPFTARNGTAAAFIPNENGTGIDALTVDDVENFVLQKTGKNYRPHVTVGLGRKDFLDAMVAAPYNPFSFKVRSVSVYHLGNFGTARKKLWSSKAPASLLKSGEEILIVRDRPVMGKLPANFRTPAMISNALEKTKSPVSREGLDNLRASGSAEPWEAAIPALREYLGEGLILMDLRQESHGFLNGAPVAWYLPPGDWINLGKTREQTLRDEKSRLAGLSRGKTVLVHEDDWIPSRIQGAGKPEKVLSAASEEELARRNNIRYFRLTVPDHMRPSDEDVDRFIAFVRGLHKADWLHFHCHAGMGRTTTFLVMYDMLLNADRVSLEDIVTRQAAAGPRYNVFRNESKAPWENVFRERSGFVRQFYEYAKAFRTGSSASWTEWLKETSGK